MYLKRITLNNFKNITDAQLDFSHKINCVLGNNGAGKTNLLDAVYYISMTKSFFSPDQFIISHNRDSAFMNGIYKMDDDCEEKIAVSLQREGDKVIKRNGKSYSRLSEHIGLLPIVMVSPADSSLINDSGDQRRRFMNFVLSQIDRLYLQHVQSYNQLLAQRNKLLKSDNISEDLLDTISAQMVPHAQYIFNSRKDLCIKLLPLVEEYYSGLSGNAEDISLEYRSDLDSAPFEEIIRRELPKDKYLKFTTAGIQRDDIIFSLDGYSIRKCGSQGQQKTFLLSVKLAQFALMKSIHGTAPILLLDDVFDKLDMNRVEYLIGIVAGNGFGQIFITDSNKVRISSIVDNFKADCANVKVEKGCFETI